MKNLFKISLVLFVLVACSSCGLLDLLETDWTFLNSSSYTIYIEPNGQSWLPFQIGPGHQIVLKLDATYDYVQFTYSPSNKVYPVDGYNQTTFYNR